MKLKSYNPRSVWQTNYLPHQIPDGLIWDKLSSQPEDVQSIFKQAKEAGRLRAVNEDLQLKTGDILVINNSSLWQLCENCHLEMFMHTGVNMNYCDWDRKGVVEIV